MDLARYALAAGVVAQVGELLGILRSAIVVVPSTTPSLGSASKGGGQRRGGGSKGKGKPRPRQREEAQQEQEQEQEEEDTMRLLGKALSLLEALAGFPASNAALLPACPAASEPILESEAAAPPPPSADADDVATLSLRPAHPMCAEVAAAFARAPALGNGLPTLAALLESEGDGQQQQQHARVLPVAWLVCPTLNHLARLDLRRVQALLGGDALQSYFSYTHSMLLRRLVAELP